MPDKYSTFSIQQLQRRIKSKNKEWLIARLIDVHFEFAMFAFYAAEYFNLAALSSSPTITNHLRSENYLFLVAAGITLVPGHAFRHPFHLTLISGFGRDGRCPPKPSVRISAREHRKFAPREKSRIAVQLLSWAFGRKRGSR